MQSQAHTVEEYLKELPEDRKNVVAQLRNIIKEYLPKGFQETMQYGMIGYSVPHSIYPEGYHCDPKQALPFMALASQKNSVNFYHMGIYADKNLHDWFVAEYSRHCKTKLDMGKSCIRFKKLNDIPYQLIGELTAKVTVNDWITLYESAIKNSRKNNSGYE